MRLALAGLLLASLAAGCADDVDLQALPSHEQCFVVVDGSLQPIAGAVIEVIAGPGNYEPSATTDVDGAACLEDLEPGTYIVDVRDTYGRAQASFEIPSDAVVRVML